jgi:hypothetical protein
MLGEEDQLRNRVSDDRLIDRNGMTGGFKIHRDCGFHGNHFAVQPKGFPAPLLHGLGNRAGQN